MRCSRPAWTICQARSGWAGIPNSRAKTLTVPNGTNLTQSTSGATDTSLQIGNLTLNGTATLTKTSTGNGGLWVSGQVTSTNTDTITLNIGITSPTAGQYDQGLHFTSNTTVAAGISTSGNGNAAFIGADGAFVGMHTFGASAPDKALYAHFGITPEGVAHAAKAKL